MVQSSKEFDYIKIKLASPSRILQWANRKLPNGQSEVIQEASYSPRGLGGQLYWYAVMPFHIFVFPTMIRNLIRSANRKDYAESNAPIYNRG